MANKYSEDALKYPVKGIVMEDNIWEFGKAKRKCKVNIPVLMPLQDPAETTKQVEKKTNAKIKDKTTDKTANYIEIYLPDSVYTYPTDTELENENATIKGASKSNPKRTADNGETKNSLARVIKKNTAIVLIFVNGRCDPGSIKCLGKYDDYEKSKVLKGNTGGISNLTATSALRTAKKNYTVKYSRTAYNFSDR